MGVPIEFDNEIYLGGTYFPTIGPVRVTNVSVTPNPVIFGDTSKVGDSQVMSQFIQSSNTGGSGVYKANPRTDTDRVWTSRLDTRWRQMLCLPPLVTSMGAPSGVTSEIVTLTAEFAANQYFCFANKVYRWQDATAPSGAWSASLKTLTANPTDWRQFGTNLYIAWGTGYSYSADGTSWSDVATAATLLEVWDSKLWRLASVSGVWTMYSSTDGTTWSAAKGTLPVGVKPHQFIVYRDVFGANCIFLTTDIGLWIYDSTNQRFLQSEVQIPRLPSSQTSRAIVFRDGRLYFGTGGLGLAGVQAGNPLTITPMGLDLEDGVPVAENGKIAALAADFNWVLSMVDATTVSSEEDTDSGLGSPFEPEGWPVESGQLTLRAWSSGWHTLWESPSIAAPGTVLAVSGAYDKRRCYFSAGSVAYYMDLPTAVYNPRQNPTGKFQAGPLTHITPWFDFGTEGQNKLHGHLGIRTKNCTSTEKVTVYYGSDLDDNTWTLLGVITANGYTEYKVGTATGLKGRHFRYRFDLQRGATTTLSPYVEFWVAEFMRVLPATYGFAAEIDFSKPHRDKTPAQLLQILKDFTNPDLTPNLIQFSFRDTLDTAPQTYYVRVMRMSGSEYAGTSLRAEGTYLVSVVAPYTGDAV